MAYLKSAYQILTEAASQDLNANLEGNITESAIRKELGNIEEVSHDVKITAEMVAVLAVDGSYLAEMGNVGSYMKDNGIKSVAKALDNIAEANKMPAKSVGLLIESDSYMNALLEAANKKKTKAAKNKSLAKLKGVTDLTDKLKKKGYAVKKKKDKVNECDNNCK